LGLTTRSVIATINRSLARKGRFWEHDGFDHLVRTEEQFTALRRYIADNPAIARVPAGPFIHFTKPLAISS
jgi:hypothetical protein